MAVPLISARRPTTLGDVFCIMCLTAMFCRLPRWLIANGLLDLRDERLCVAHDGLPFFLADGHDHHPIGSDAVDKDGHQDDRRPDNTCAAHVALSFVSLQLLTVQSV